MSLLQILYTDHKFLRNVIEGIPSVHNRLWSTSQKRFEYASNTSLKHVKKKPFNLMIHLENVLKMFWRCREDVLKTSWKRLIKMSWRRFENVLKTYWRFLEDFFARRLGDVLETYDQDENISMKRGNFDRFFEVFQKFGKYATSYKPQLLHVKQYDN